MDVDSPFQPDLPEFFRCSTVVTQNFLGKSHKRILSVVEELLKMREPVPREP
jgi:hypothetical protein